MFDLRFPPVLKMAIYLMLQETYLYLATLDSTGGSSALMRRTWVWGFASLLTQSPSRPAITNPEHLSNLWCIIAVYSDDELELKVIRVIGNSTIFLLVASFVMEKNKSYSYDAGYKLKVIAYANRAAKRHFSPPPTEKTICDWHASKEELKKWRFSGILKVSSVL